jgi:CheY-like chemotaxis protein
MPGQFHILVGDDNFINRQYFTLSLTKSDYQVVAVESGKLAIEMAQEHCFDIILMDIRMPEIDGYEAAMRIKLNSKNQETPIIAISAEYISLDDDKLFDDFLLKPIKRDQLLQIIRKYQQFDDRSYQVFNPISALEYAYNDKSIMHQLVALFKQELPSQIELISSYLRLDNFDKCLNIIHKTRGSCRTCGAEILDFRLEQLSNAIAKKNSNQVTILFIQVDSSAKEYLNDTLT